MKLLKVFNTNFLKFFKILNRSFCDSILDQLLTAEVHRIEWELDNSNYQTKEFFESFDSDTKDFIDDIFKKKEYLIVENKFKFLHKLNFSFTWTRFKESEKLVFWKNLISLCRYAGMLKACGNELTSMEDMALKFMENKADVAPDQYHMELFKEMLAGGDMSKQLVETFKNPDCIKNILGNVSTIMRSDDADNSKGTSNTFADILNMTSMFDDNDISELQNGMVDTLSKNIVENGEENDVSSIQSTSNT